MLMVLVGFPALHMDVGLCGVILAGDGMAVMSVGSS